MQDCNNSIADTLELLQFYAKPSFCLCERVLLDWGAWDYLMMASSNGNIFRVTGPLCGEFTGPGEFPTQRPVTRSFDVFIDLRLNKQLSKQPWGWWFETPPWSLWRQCNVKSAFRSRYSQHVWKDIRK